MNARVLVLMSGSISAYKVCHVLSRLKQSGHEIEVVASPWALKFIGEATIEGLTGRPVRKSMFGSGAHMAHINLIRWADLAIVCPATANTINKLASGIGDDLMTTLFLAHDFVKPWLIAPAMNTKMYHHPVTQASVQKLRAIGCEILETASGVLACGEIGDGKLLDSELLLAEVLRRLPKTRLETKAIEASPTPGHGKRILITSGGTSEPIDAVRSITNTSTGTTGAMIAETMLGLGHTVHFVSAGNSVQPRSEELGAADRFTSGHFNTYADLAKIMQASLVENKFDAVIHAAAVSDYSMADGPSKMKTDSAAEMTLKLTKNPKLLESIRKWSKNPDIKVVAFKLTATRDLAERKSRLQKLIDGSKPDFVVVNDQNEMPLWQLIDASHESEEITLVAEGKERERLGFALESVLTEGVLAASLSDEGAL